jgi:hypothetical protein
MTACVNKKSKRVAAVVTASLVGALSIGAPAVALAANANIDMLVNDAAGSFSKGTITEIDTTNGLSVSDNTVTTAYTGGKIEVVPTKVTTAAGKQVDDINTSGDFRISYVKADSKGNPTTETVGSIVEPGRYCVKVEAIEGDYAGGVAYLKVVVTGASLTGAAAYEINASDDSNLDDTTFTYTGSDLEIGFKLNKKALVEGEDYDVQWQTVSGDVDAPEAAGTYYAVLTGKGVYAGSEKNVTVPVKTFDLSSADVVFDPVVKSNVLPKPAYIKLADGTQLDTSLVKVEITAFKNDSDTTPEGFTKAGAYTVTVSNADPDNKSIENNKSNLVIKKYSDAATVLYDGEAVPSEFVTNLNDKKPSFFDVSAFSGVYGEDETEIKNTGVAVTVLDEDGRVVCTYANASGAGSGSSTDWYKTKGVYTVKAAAAADYAAAGVATCKVTVKATTVDADANVFVTYDGKEITSLVADWSTAGISVSDFVAKGTDAKGGDISSDLDVKVTDADGKEVESTISDAGEYTLTVSSDKYELEGSTTVKITVNKLDLADLVLGGTTEKFGSIYVDSRSGQTTLASAITPQYKEGVDTDANGKLDRKEVPNVSEIAVKFQKLNEKTGVWADATTIEQNETGKFRVVVSPVNEDALKNFSFATEEGTAVEFHAIKGSVAFADVLPGDYWFDAVAAVSEAKYMNGYSGTQFFGSADTLTRGQVACVLYNMAVNYDKSNSGSDKLVDETVLNYDKDKGYVTGFSDVDGTVYYGKAIAWAKQAGVVNGYGDGTFAPDADVTREEFAAMVANFAKMVNGYKAPADDALAGMTDASSVSAWAEESVAWAVENGIMGNGGFVSAQEDITRADAACMVYNYAF